MSFFEGHFVVSALDAAHARQPSDNGYDVENERSQSVPSEDFYGWEQYPRSMSK